VPLTNAGSEAGYTLSTFDPYIRNYLSNPPIRELRPPALGFLRKVDSTGAIGDYYGRADLRLTMQYDRAVPFDLTSIQTGTGALGTTCASTMDIPDDRQEKSTAKCNTFNKGQLNSLQQPVLVLTRNNTEEKDRFCKQVGLNDIDTITPTPELNSLTDPQKDRVLRALQIAIAASPTPVEYNNVITSGVLPNPVQTTFKDLLDRIKTADSSLSFDSATVSQLAPSKIAAIRNSCFLPAPIQKLVNPTSGKETFYDRREGREMKLLQTNIESLTVWNRDGVYVSFGADLTANTVFPSTTDLNIAFDDVITATPTTYSTNGLLFVRDAANTSATTGSFQKLGLAAKDRTEGGLVLHAILDDATYPIDTSDNRRKYTTTTSTTVTDSNYNYGKYRSPFGFVFNGGKNLPGPLTIATDQGIYLQGDYNNFGLVSTANQGEKQPAAILSDTITILSNSCLSTSNSASSISSTITDGIALGIPKGKINCLVNERFHRTETTSVYAAFAANNDASCGSLGSNVSATYCARRRQQKGLNSTDKFYGGGLQNSIRMLENWDFASSGGGQRTFTYRGSMVSLGTPQEFEGPIVYDDVYDTPVRDYGFDPAFNYADKLPPLTPRAVSIEQNVFKRTFN
jgi:hypothetical protein